MKVLVTGGAGFIGSNLVDGLIAEGCEVIVLDNFLRGNKLPQPTAQGIRIVSGDVRDEALVLELTKGCRWVFHLAAYLGVDIVAENPVETMETEALGTRNVANAAIVNGVEKLIYASTSGVYGKAAIEQAVEEDFAVSPGSSYSIAKRYNEIYLRSLFQEKNLQSASLRYFNVYGPRQDNRMVIPRFMENALRGAPIPIYGDGKQSRDFTYIDDVVAATIAVAKHSQNCEIFNIARGDDISIARLAEEIVALSGTSTPIQFVDTPPGRYDFEVERRCGNSDKLKRITGTVLRTQLDEGLKRTWNSLRAEISNSSPATAAK